MRWPWTRRADELQNRIDHLEHAFWEEQRRVDKINQALRKAERTNARFKQHTSAVAEVLSILVPGADEEYKRIEEWNDKHPSGGEPFWFTDGIPSDEWAEDLPDDPEDHPTHGWCPPVGSKDEGPHDE